MPLYRNISNQKLYKVISDLVIDATNGAEERLMVLYKDSNGHRYVRERIEFYKKFEKSIVEKF